MKNLLILFTVFAVPYSLSKQVQITSEADLISNPDIKILKVKTKKCREYSFEYCGKNHTWNKCGGRGPVLMCDETHDLAFGTKILPRSNKWRGGGHGPVVIHHSEEPMEIPSQIYCREGYQLAEIPGESDNDGYYCKKDVNFDEANIIR